MSEWVGRLCRRVAEKGEVGEWAGCESSLGALCCDIFLKLVDLSIMILRDIQTITRSQMIV